MEVILVIIIGLVLWFRSEDKKMAEEREAEYEKKKQEQIELLEKIVKEYQDKLNLIENKYQAIISSDENVKTKLQELQDYIYNPIKEIVKSNISLSDIDSIIEKTNTYTYRLNVFEHLCLWAKYNYVTSQEVTDIEPMDFEREKKYLAFMRELTSLTNQSREDIIVKVCNYTIRDSYCINCKLSIINNSITSVNSISLYFKIYSGDAVVSNSSLYKRFTLEPGEKYESVVSIYSDSILDNNIRIKLEGFFLDL